MTTPPDILLGLSPADRAELTRLLVEHGAALADADRYDQPGPIGHDAAIAWGEADERREAAERALATWTRAHAGAIPAPLTDDERRRWGWQGVSPNRAGGAS